MYLPGHLAMGYLAAAGPAFATGRPLDVRYALIPALVGTVTPDAIDKPLQVLGLTATSRTLGHSLLFFVLLIVLWHWIRHRRTSFSRPFGWWIVGIGTHLAIDLVNDGFRGLEVRGYFITGWPGWPFTTTDDFQILLELGPEIQVHPTFTSLEIAVYALTLVLAIASRYYGPKPGGIGG